MMLHVFISDLGWWDRAVVASDDTSLGEWASMQENRAGMQNNSNGLEMESGKKGMTGASVVRSL